MEPGRGWATPLPTQNIARKLDPPHSLQVKLTSLLHPLQSASEDPGDLASEVLNIYRSVGSSLFLELYDSSPKTWATFGEIFSTIMTAA